MVNIDKVLNVRDDSEMSMAKSDLYNLAKNSVELYKLIQGLNELEGWTQAKIKTCQRIRKSPSKLLVTFLFYYLPAKTVVSKQKLIF